jgi:hypothetical protein
MTAPRRRWSFSLQTIFVVVTVAAMLSPLIPKWILRSHDSGPFVSIAAIDSNDAMVDAVADELALHGIDSYSEGSIVYGVFVPLRHAEAAKRILRTSPRVARAGGIMVSTEEFPATQTGRP